MFCQGSVERQALAQIAGIKICRNNGQRQSLGFFAKKRECSGWLTHNGANVILNTFVNVFYDQPFRCQERFPAAPKITSMTGAP